MFILQLCLSGARGKQVGAGRAGSCHHTQNTCRWIAFLGLGWAGAWLVFCGILLPISQKSAHQVGQSKLPTNRPGCALSSEARVLIPGAWEGPSFLSQSQGLPAVQASLQPHPVSACILRGVSVVTYRDLLRDEGMSGPGMEVGRVPASNSPVWGHGSVASSAIDPSTREAEARGSM